MSKPRRLAKPAEGSLRWYENEWLRAFLSTPKSGEHLPHIKMLAQLSYENARLRDRVAICESLLFTMTTGMVRDDRGDRHLFGCSVREGKDCDCGSTPKKEQGT